MMCGGLIYTKLNDSAMQALYMSVFQTGWFIESMWSQMLVIHMIRTEKVPFIQSRSSLSLMIMSFIGILAVTLMPFTPLAGALELAVLPMEYFVILIALVIGYIALATCMKKLYIRRLKKLL